MPIPLIPLRKSTLATVPLPVVMSGVRLGERVLQIGIDDPAIAGAIAAKTGVSGRAAFAVDDDRAAARARKASENAMAVADIEIALDTRLPFADEAFDLVVLHARSGTRDEVALGRLLREALRTLRPGGRFLAMQQGTAAGLASWFRGSATTPGGGVVEALTRAGFRAVRVLADREGYLFTEGLRPQA